MISNKIKELEQKLEKKETVRRAVLGTKEKRYLSEIISANFCLKIEDCTKEREQLEQQIFELAEVEKMFRYILNASVSVTPNALYNISMESFGELPDMFARYFQPAGLFAYDLYYSTTGRVRRNLRKTLDMLLDSPRSRQGYIPIWNTKDNDRLGEMVPSLIGFHIQLTDAEMVLSVTIRSCDIEFLPYDLWYFLSLGEFCLQYLNRTELKLILNMNIFNLHQYKTIKT